MSFLLAFIRLFRIPNLIMVFLTMYIPYWLVLRPAILEAGGIPMLTERLFNLIAIATVLTTFGGYVLNDWYDREMDAINKPRRVFWGKYLPANLGLIFYALIVTASHGLAFIINQELQPRNHWPLWVYPMVSFLLFLYAWQMKCSVIIGNLLVSFLCAIVPIIVLLPEERALWLSSFVKPDLIQKAVALVWLYAVFAFVFNFLREQIKDLEDFPGDSACGCSTLPVVKGVVFARKPVVFTGLLASGLIGVLLMFWTQTQAPDYQIVAGCLFLLIPTLIATIRLFWSKSSRDFKVASLMVKIVMFFGIILLLRSWPENPMELINQARDFAQKTF
ncbi:MAG: geranylgeranylglycerol-phosphate geranylgeranyltransferase [Lewinellaceae bacterium]|nr:geranylgeranylglycerol-phosphate geranylgeranyltransferase [Saprospiraceae bacterium]MCB9343638.1 geranylgeranylglycerol-phosphate geranylgeranyltransferase [Lewinellaceae bacterium]